MRLTETEIINNKKPIIMDNRVLLDGDCKRYNYRLIIETNTERNKRKYKIFQIMFNKDISTNLYITFYEWIKACNIFDTKFDNIEKCDIDSVPRRIKNSQEVIDYLNDMFDTKDNRVLNIRWAVFHKE